MYAQYNNSGAFTRFKLCLSLMAPVTFTVTWQGVWCLSGWVVMYVITDNSPFPNIKFHESLFSISYYIQTDRQTRHGEAFTSISQHVSCDLFLHHQKFLSHFFYNGMTNIKMSLHSSILTPQFLYIWKYFCAQCRWTNVSL
jgi:hypothetical protein